MVKGIAIIQQYNLRIVFVNDVFGYPRKTKSLHFFSSDHLQGNNLIPYKTSLE